MKFSLPGYKKLNPIILFLLLVFLLRLGISSCLRLVEKETLPNSGVNSPVDKINTGGQPINLPMKILAEENKFIGDSWLPMTAANIYFEQNPKGPVYDSLLRNKISKFIYPPSSLLMFYLPHNILGISYTKIVHGLDHFALFCILLIGILSSLILLSLLKEPQFEEFRISTKYERTAIVGLVCLLTFRFYPITYAAQIGQIQTELTLLGTMSILCWQLDKKYLSGILIGLICLVKPQIAMVLLWGAIRRQWKMVLGGVTIILPCLLLSIAIFGFKNHLEYLSVLSFLSHHGESYYTNQSVNGLMNRLLFNGDNLTYSDSGYPPYSPVVYVVTLISAMLFSLPALLWNYKSKSPGIVELCIIILTSIIASPIAWEHHYGMVFPIFIVLMPFIVSYFRKVNWVWYVSIFSFILVAKYLDVTKHLAESGLNILQSYLFIGALSLLIILYCVSYLQRRRHNLEIG